MFCSKCGSKIAEGSKFCSVCGESVKPASNNNSFSDYDEPTILAGSLGEEPTKLNEPVSFDRPPVYPNGADTMQGGNNGYYPPAYGVNPPAAEEGKKKTKKDKKKKGPKKIILSIIAVVLALVIISGSAFGIFYAANPEFQLAWAIERTLLESKGFDFSFVAREEWGNSESIELRVDGIVDLGETTADSNLYFTASNTECWDEYYMDGYYDWTWYKTEDVYDAYGWYERTDYYYEDGYISQGEERWVEPQTVPAGESFETYYGAFCNGEGVVGGSYGENNTAYEGIFFAGTTENLLNELEVICEESEDIRDGMKNYADLSVSDAFRMARELISKEKVNKDVIKELFDGSLAYFMDEQFNADMFTYNETMKILADFFINGITEEAFEITDTYTEDGIKMRDVRVDLNELMVCLNDFIDDHDEVRDLLDDIDPDICEGIEELADEEEFEEDFKFTIGTKNGYFCYFESDFYDEFDVELKITNINKPTDVTSYYNDVEAIAKEWEESYFYVETYDDVVNAIETYEENN